mmetsp:Transcript_27660/g.30199  ORF Transcript_27660/g.30199 Transcript_27660/m.30199 type:complete len:274 (+) Transcript_27660:56-877(+)
MEIFVVDVIGRHHKITDITVNTTVEEVKQQLAPKLGQEDTSSIILLTDGVRRNNQDLISSLGLTFDNQSSFKMYAAVQRKLNRSLFDGRPHPFVLNDLPIGGRSPYKDIASSPCSYEDFLHELQIPLADVSEIDEAMHQRIQSFEEENFIQLPTCIKDFILSKELPNLCCQKLAMNPFVIDAENTWQYPIFIALSEDKFAFLFLADHQGCCSWYGIWTQPVGEGAVNDCQVYVHLDGEEFDLNRSTYLTSNHFWQFLTDYARKSTRSYTPYSY